MSLQELLESIRTAPTPQNEESAKIKVLLPVLQSLGWDPRGSDVQYEYPVGGEKGGGKADIALRGPGKVVALIEAKAPGANLDKHVEQVLNYAFHDGMGICVLTTGLEWWLYLPLESGPPQDRRFAILSIQNQPVEQLAEDLSAFLAKDNLVSGKAKRQAQLVLRANLEAAHLKKEIPSIWKGMLSEPDEDLVELLGKRVYDKLNLRPTKPQIVAALQDSPIPSATATAEPSVAPSPAPDQPPTTAKRKSPRPSVKPAAIELWGQRHPVKSHKEVLTTVIDRLFEQHRDNFDRVLELKGRKFPYAARDPRGVKYGDDSDGGHYYEPAGSGIFFDTHLSANDIERRARLFVAHFGHDPSDFKVLYE